MIAILGALAFLLMFLEFPVIPIVSYLKLDFSDVPVLIGTLLDGPVTGIMIAVVKCLLHGLVHGFAPVEFLGLGADFCSSLALIFLSFHLKELMLVGVLPFNLLKGALISLVFAIVVVHLRHNKRFNLN